jgi:beta-N-acetylhexosaminidase
MLQKIGPVMLDLIGTRLSTEEYKLLQHPLVGGVILFSRNYLSIQQLTELCSAIREARQGPLLIAVDHEGGRVQRFRTDFTALPNMGMIGQWYDNSREEGLQFAEICGWIMAAELLAAGIDLSFAPVLDLNKELNQVIGDRAFHRNSSSVIELAKALIHGMSTAGMASTGKHFPGHGSVSVDSHVSMPIDSRELTDIIANDMQPFIALHSHLQAIMPAHILFPSVDNKSVGFSEYWLQTVLRTQLEYSGVIFSDDLNMVGASTAGDYPERALAALNAGCDMILICNNRLAAVSILDHLTQQSYQWDDEKFKILQGKFSHSVRELHTLQEWQEKQALLNRKRICSLITQ